MKIFLYTCLALIAFAGNSVLCRLALGEDTVDAASFTIIRLLSGIVVLALLIKVISVKKRVITKGSWKASFMLFIYAITFSFAYVSLETGIGALILFASVQITMIAIGQFQGDKLHAIEWGGVVIAFSGFVYLLLPSLGTPSFVGFLLMILAGCSWGVYTIFGKSAVSPLHDTAYNFIRTLPFVFVLFIFSFQYSHLSVKGVLLAILSGAVTSGIGYALWYFALKGLSTTQAAVVQLLVPIVAAFGGVIFAHEQVSVRLLVSSATILGGIFFVVVGKQTLLRQK